MSNLLEQIIVGEHTNYALISRNRGRGRNKTIELLAGPVSSYDSLSDIPLPSLHPENKPNAILTVIPFCQLREKKFDVQNDNVPLLAMSVLEQSEMEMTSFVDNVPPESFEVSNERFDLEDKQYSRIVQEVVNEYIGRGEGSNVVMYRNYELGIDNFSPLVPIEVFIRLLLQDPDAYWTFLVRLEDKWIVGATPEQHVAIKNAQASMTPLSGTYPLKDKAFQAREILDFLNDQKEIDELNMVVDEELKMMAHSCSNLRVEGPHLHQLSNVVHTGYRIIGEYRDDPRKLLHDTLFAPTVTGAPVKNACRMISSIETTGRGYYSGVVAIIEGDQQNQFELDSAILIRSAEISSNGDVRIGAGATIVRDSNPAGECEETRSKVSAILRAFNKPRGSIITARSDIANTLQTRKQNTALYWTSDEHRQRQQQYLRQAMSKSIVLDAEDSFSYMIAAQMCGIGLQTEVVGVDTRVNFENYDLVILGPGPGDPCNLSDPRIGRLHEIVAELVILKQPFLAICLSHQVLAKQLKIPLVRLKKPNQGTQKEINYFGKRQRVGFYNTFTGICSSQLVAELRQQGVSATFDADTRELHALRGRQFSSMQFHPESFLTIHGVDLLASEVRRVIKIQREL
nr:chorismate-binding protein [Actinomyces oris]